MEPLYGTGTDPVPYFALAFGLATLGLLGFYFKALRERQRLRQLLQAITKKV